ncbi:hypothetical protein F2P79_001878 [Pimephales promelas]|nr:hypothetical protein F2P79_001878 [Pimephales promelas]
MGWDGAVGLRELGGLGWFRDPLKVPLPWKRSWLNKIPISRQIRYKLGSVSAQATLLPGADSQSRHPSGLVSTNASFLRPITAAPLVCACATAGRRHPRPVRFCVVEQNRCGREEEEEGNSCSPHRSRFPSLTGRQFSRGPSGLRSSGSEGDFYGGGETRNGPELAGFFPSQGQALVFSHKNLEKMQIHHHY